ncbi:hypothetical protein [Micromonospora thermarum]|uniref:hypothetical protein n=1 Tax=Micromonospora thermarum TaxID=2720024 RepID=UPI001F109816|nr:hypothetical protein [Micromonospora thermarum]
MTDDTDAASGRAPGTTNAPRAKRTPAKKATSGRTTRTEAEPAVGVDAPAADAPTATRAKSATKRTTKAAPKDAPARARRTTRTAPKPAIEQEGPATVTPPTATPAPDADAPARPPAATTAPQQDTPADPPAAATDPDAGTPADPPAAATPPHQDTPAGPPTAATAPSATTAEDDYAAPSPHARTPADAAAAPTTPQPDNPAHRPVLTRTPEVVARRVLDHPGYAPELLALAAVQGVGPRARDWAERLRSAYPKATGDGLARLATRRYVRQAGAGGGVAALAGVFAPVAELGAVLWTQASLVLHLAAAYDRDPTHPDRAVELLVLTQVHPDADSARAALQAARAADGPGEAPWPRAVEAAWRLAAPLAAQAGGWLALRLVSRLLPGAAALAAATGDAAATERLAARAVAAYRPPRTARVN